MEYYFCIILLVSGVSGQKPEETVIFATSVENLLNKNIHAVNLDQITASGNINRNINFGGINEEPNGYYGGNFERFISNIDDSLDKKYNDNEKLFTTPGNYKFEFDDGNPDIHGDIERPCQAYDTFCIRKFFAEHSRCKISGRAVPDPLFRAQFSVNFAYLNSSATLNNAEYKGLKDARVEEFYINKATDNLLITLAFDSVSLVSNDVNFKYYFSGREPTVTRDFGNINFVKLSITVVIPHINDLRLDRAEITTFLNAIAIPPFVPGPRLALSTDPEVPLTFAAILPTVQLAAQEFLLAESAFYAGTYIQYNICDFGLKLL